MPAIAPLPLTQLINIIVIQTGRTIDLAFEFEVRPMKPGWKLFLPFAAAFAMTGRAAQIAR